MKTPTHYFVYVGHGTQTKNKLQADFKTYLESLAGTIVQAANVKELKQEIMAKVDELNQVHKRCAPLQLKLDNLYTKDGFYITGFYFLTFQILKGYDRN